MTIVVVFGSPELLSVPHGRYVSGNAEDRLYFANDKNYVGTGEQLNLPQQAENTLLPVIQHASSGSLHKSQLNWLRNNENYEPLPVDYFHHKGEFFDRLKSLLTAASPDNSNEVSSFVGSCSGRMALKLIDELAAWNTLCLLCENDNSPQAQDCFKSAAAMRTRLRLKVQPFLEADLNDPNENPYRRWPAVLETEAVRYC